MRYLLTYKLIASAATLLCFWVQSSAQDAQHDSLLQVVDTSKVDSLKVDALLEISTLLVFSYPDSAGEYIQRGHDLSKSIDYGLGIAKSLNNFGIQNLMQGDNLEALEYFQAAEEKYLELGKNRGAALCMNNIGIIHNKLEEYRKAIEQYKKAYKLSSNSGDHRMHGYGLFNVASNYSEVGAYDTALMYIDSLKILEAEKGPITPSFDLKAHIFNRQGQLDSAAVNYKLAIEEGLEMENLHNESSLYLSLGQVQLEQQLFDEAEASLKRANEIAVKNGYSEIERDYLKTAAQLEATRGNFKKAFSFNNQFIALKDSLTKVNSAEEINELNAKYHTAQKDKELAENKRRAALREAESEMRTWISIVIIVCALGLILAVFFFLKKQWKINGKLRVQHSEIDRQRKSIISSIEYAQKIQNSILIPEDEIRQILPSTFIYFRPKDIVSGDFYWFNRIGNKIIVAAIDCTGHGVPGAFMSLIAHNKMNRVINQRQIVEPGRILNELHTEIVTSLRQQDEKENAQDGMDMSICVIDQDENTIEFAGAQNSIVLVRGEKLEEIKADRISIGGRFSNNVKFTSHKITYEKGDFLYMFSDGYFDQFGGEDNKKLNKTKFREILQEISSLPPDAAKSRLDEHFEKWRGARPQLDDMLVIGTEL